MWQFALEADVSVKIRDSEVELLPRSIAPALSAFSGNITLMICTDTCLLFEVQQAVVHQKSGRRYCNLCQTRLKILMIL